MAEKCYFGCLPKEEVPKFIAGLKKALGEEKKTGEKQSVSVEIKGTKNVPKGITIETFGVDKSNYKDFADSSQAYMSKALTAFTVSIGVKDEASVPVIKALFDQFSPMIAELPWIKKKPGKYEYYFRSSGKRVFFDFISVDGEFIKPLLDLGIDITDFHKFKASFKTEFCPDDFFQLKVEDFSLKALQLLVSITAKTENVKYLVGSTLKALKEVKLTNEKFQKKLDKVVQFLSFINSFVGSEFQLEFDAKELCSNGISASKEFTGGVDINQTFAGFKEMILQLGNQMIKPTLQNMGLLDGAKAADIDEVAISITCPKYQNGIAHVIKLPGFSKAFNEKFLA